MQSTDAVVDPTEGKIEQNGTETQQDPPKPQLGIRFWLAFWAIAFTNLAAAFDATTLSVALPAISTTLGPSPSAFWAGTSYLLACTILMLIWVTLSDAFGRRPVLLTALTFFTLGAIICGIADTWRTLLAGRTIQGLGGGGLISLTTVIITDLVPLRERARFNAMVSTVWAMGSATGPVLGGVLAVRGEWRWIFWINLPIVAVGVVGIGMFLRLKRRNRTLGEKLALFDFPGSFLFIASVTTFLIPVTWGGVQYAWGSRRTVVPLVLGLLGLVGFVGYEVLIARSTRSPTGNTEESPNKRGKPLLIPPSVFPSLTTLTLYTTSTFHGLTLFSLVYYMPEYFQSVKSYTPVIAGVASLPGTITTVPCAILVGVVVAVTGRYRWALWVGWALTCLGIGLLILLDEATSVVQWVFIQGVSGLGIGCLFPSISIAVQASVPQREAGVAATLVLFFRSLGQALGVAVGGVILDNRLRRHLSTALLAGLRTTTPAAETFNDRALNAATLVEILNHLPTDSPEAMEIWRALVKSFRVIWMVICAFAGLNLVASLFVREYGLDQALETEQGFVHESSGASGGGERHDAQEVVKEREGQ
ncbi:major facilitator superfamily domain-containing protein [Aspergillus insuetus]